MQRPTTTEPGTDVAAVERLVHEVLAAFVSGPDCAPRLDALRQSFVPGAVVVRTCGDEPLVLDVDGFIAPRRELLLTGDLTDFREWHTGGHTEVFGDIAHHFCSYAKAWVQDGVAVTGSGMKTVQCVRTREGWRISALAWDDERPGVPGRVAG